MFNGLANFLGGIGHAVGNVFQPQKQQPKYDLGSFLSQHLGQAVNQTNQAIARPIVKAVKPVVAPISTAANFAVKNFIPVEKGVLNAAKGATVDMPTTIAKGANQVLASGRQQKQNQALQQAANTQEDMAWKAYRAGKITPQRAQALITDAYNQRNQANQTFQNQIKAAPSGKDVGLALAGLGLSAVGSAAAPLAKLESLTAAQRATLAGGRLAETGAGGYFAGNALQQVPAEIKNIKNLKGAARTQAITEAALNTGLGVAGGLATVHGLHGILKDPVVANEHGFIGGGSATGFPKAEAKGQTFIGADGKPRFEFSDKKAQVLDTAVPRLQKGETVPLREVLKHPELEKNYPTLFGDGTGGVKVKLANLPDAKAVFDPKTNTISVNPKILPDLKSNLTKKTLVHELQHAGQVYEGHATGTTPQAQAALVNNPDLVKAQNYLNTNEERFKVLQDNLKQGLITKDQFQSDPFVDNYRVTQERAKRLSAAQPLDNGFPAYKASAGEIEAETAASRANMSPRQLRKNPIEQPTGRVSLNPQTAGSNELMMQAAEPNQGVQIGKNDKATAQNLRDAYTGYKNSEIVSGNQLSDTVKKLAPKEQNAIFWYNEAGGDPKTLKSWATDGEPLTKAHIPDIQAAMNLSPQAKQAAGLLQEYYKGAGTKALDTGAIKTIRSDYNNARLYKSAPPEDFVSTGLGKDLKLNTSHSKQRVYNTMHEAILNGKIPATTNAADLMSIHNEELARVNASRVLATQMTDSRLGKMIKLGDTPPPGYKSVLTNGGQVLTAPEHIAKGLKAISDPNFLNNYETYKGVKKFQGLVKTVDLSYSLFHHFTMAAQTLYQTAAHPIDTAKMVQGFTKDIAPLEKDFVEHTGITAKVHQNMDVMHMINGNDSKLRNIPGVKQFLDGTNKSSDILFGTMQRYLKVTDYGTKAANWVGDHPNATNEEVTLAKRSIAKEVNAAYGGLNFESMGIDKSVQGALRTILLAPDWTLSNLQLGKMAFEKSPGGSAARQHIATALIGGVLATEAMNKALTGHWTNKNEKGHEFEVQLQPGVYVSLLRGGIGDLVKVGSMISENGLATGTGRFLQGKFSPVLRTAIGLATGRNYNGQAITKKGDNFLKDTVNEGKFIAQSAGPIPFGASSSLNYNASGQPTSLLNQALLATGLARYSAVPSTSDNSAKPKAAKAGDTPGGNIKTSTGKTATSKSAQNARDVYGDVTLTKPIQDSANRVETAKKKFTPNLDQSSKDTLTRYARLTDAGKKVFNADPQNKYNLAVAKFAESGGKTPVQAFKTQQSLDKQKITSKFPDAVVQFYGLSGAQKNAMFKSDPTTAQDLYTQAKQLAQALGDTTGAKLKVSAPKVAKARAPKIAKTKIAKTPKIAKLPSFKAPKAKLPKASKLAKASSKKLKMVA